MKPISVKEESRFKLNNTRHSIFVLLMLGARCFLLLLISRDRFTFADLGLNLLYHVQIFRIGPVIV